MNKSKYKFMKKIIILYCIFFSTSCSLMFNGGAQTIRIQGKEDAKVLITTPSGSYEDKLPTTVVAQSSYSPIEIKVIDERYQSTSNVVGKRITPSFWANFLNSVGFIIDGVTGSFWNYDNITDVRVVEKK